MIFPKAQRLPEQMEIPGFDGRYYVRQDGTVWRRYKYFYAVKSNYIRKPLSWALYTAWKYIDAREAARGAENAENEPEAQAGE